MTLELKTKRDMKVKMSESHDNLIDSIAISDSLDKDVIGGLEHKIMSGLDQNRKISGNIKMNGQKTQTSHCNYK